jgi:hypothetical protein
LSDISHSVEVSLLICLFLTQVYFLVKLFSYADEEYLRKYRFLGPFAFIVPGVIKPGGSKFLLCFLITTTAIFMFALLVFEFDKLGFP